MHKILKQNRLAIINIIVTRVRVIRIVDYHRSPQTITVLSSNMRKCSSLFSNSAIVNQRLMNKETQESAKRAIIPTS